MASQLVVSGISARLNFTIGREQAIKLVARITSEINNGEIDIPLELIGDDMFVYNQEAPIENPHHG